MTHPLLVIILAGVAGWVFAAIWYSVLARQWQHAMAINPRDRADRKMPLVPMLIALIAAFVMAATLYQILTNLGVTGVGPGALAGLTIGAGFLLTSTIVNNTFQKKSWTLTMIDGGHWVLAVTIEAVVITALS